MYSKKCQKYLEQYQERNYAPKNRKLEKYDFKKYSDGSSGRKAYEASRSDRLQQSREIEEEKDLAIQVYGKYVQLEEEEEEENLFVKAIRDALPLVWET